MSKQALSSGDRSRVDLSEAIPLALQEAVDFLEAEKAIIKLSSLRLLRIRVEDNQINFIEGEKR